MKADRTQYVRSSSGLVLIVVITLCFNLTVVVVSGRNDILKSDIAIIIIIIIVQSAAVAWVRFSQPHQLVGFLVAPKGEGHAETDANR